jgi:hypothetical protein
MADGWLGMSNFTENTPPPDWRLHDRLNRRQLAEYLSWAPGTVQKLVAAEAWRWDERPTPAFHQRGSRRTHWLFADVADLVGLLQWARDPVVGSQRPPCVGDA